MNTSKTTVIQTVLVVCGAVGSSAAVAHADPDRIAGVVPLRIFAHNEQGGLRRVIDSVAGGFDCRGEGAWVTAVHGPNGPSAYCSITAISPDGYVAVGWALSTNPSGGAAPMPFAWTPCDGAGTVGAGLSGALGGQALGVAVGGHVVVGISHGSATDSGFRLFAANAADLIVDQTTQYDTSLRAVSADGEVVVGSGADALGRQALVFVNGWDHVRSLGDLLGGTSWSDAYGVSGDGRIIVGQSMSSSGPQAFSWSDDTGMVGLGDLSGGAFDSAALAVSANGRVIVGTSMSAAGPQAFRWSAQTGMVGLGDLPGGGFASEALAVSGDGSLVVGRSLTENGFEAFIWQHPTGMRSLRTVLASRLAQDADVPFLVSANGISASGEVIGGSALNVQGTVEGWVARLPQSTCAADWNQDGVSNSLDYFAFLQSFFSFAGDVNGDGVSDTADFFEFLTAFFEGC